MVEYEICFLTLALSHLLRSCGR